MVLTPIGTVFATPIRVILDVDPESGPHQVETAAQVEGKGAIRLRKYPVTTKATLFLNPVIIFWTDTGRSLYLEKELLAVVLNV